MGSKRMMLQNGLGELISECAPRASRIVDLLCGAGSVAWFAAEKTNCPVLAIDLQDYAVTLARAVVGRDAPLDPVKLSDAWLPVAKRHRNRCRLWHRASKLEDRSTKRLVESAREICAMPSSIGPIWNAYGGYYYSPAQALTLDYMLRYLPANVTSRVACRAAAIWAASKCAAAPGHTAQPFRPTRSAGRFIREAWQRDPLVDAKAALAKICPRHARVTGESLRSDALEIAPTLTPKDLVIVDLPYSGVQYSRFYHVLETIARGTCGPVEGAGRYPAIQERPQSSFCNKSESKTSLDKLLSTLATAGCSVILTFPSGECSNGLSGQIVTEMASTRFDIRRRIVKTSFSTLGGNNAIRKARNSADELLLHLQPNKKLQPVS